jgi:type II secretory pathway pseudopilin PulG
VTRGERGYALIALLAGASIALIAMSAAVPGWKYVILNDREEELLFRGGEIADAIRRYQQKNGNALPTSLEQLVKGRFLRKAYKDPMSKDGEWRLVRQGEPLLPPQIGRPGQPSPSPSPGARQLPAAGGSVGGGPITGGSTTGPRSPTGVGAILGVASRNTSKSLRLFNGRQRYNEWVFVAGQPRVVGRQTTTPGVPPGQPGPGQPRPGGGLTTTPR